MPSRFDPAPLGKVTRRAVPSASHPIGLTRLLVDGVALVPAAVLLHLDALAVVDLALHRDVVAPLAVLARERDLDAFLVLGHIYSLALCGARYVRRGRSLAGEFARSRSLTASGHPESRITTRYFSILTTRPEPTVRPPSRIANRNPSSIAIGLPSSTLISVLSPGITISVPSGNATVPVTSVVRK